MHSCINKAIKKDYRDNIFFNTIDYKNNIENGKLVLINLSKYYIDATTDNFQKFDKLKEKIMDHIKRDHNRKDKHIRITVDCAMFLMSNRYFDECINL